MSQSRETKEAILGIDYGLTNTGLALAIDGVVSPFRIVNSKNFNYFQSEISTLITKYRVKKIVIGIPLSYDGKDNKQSIIVRQVVSNISKKTRNKVNDHYSAAIILESYFENLN